jgi:predicted DCC family thiol-disulfide oxidoreductase YuxK
MKLFYDDDCGLCTRSVRWLALRTSGVEYEKLSEGLGEQSAVLLETEDGAHLHGVDAISVVLRQCGTPWRAVGSALLLPGVAQLSAKGYRLVARNRSRISRKLGWGVCEIEPHSEKTSP